MTFHPCVSGCGRFLSSLTATITVSHAWETSQLQVCSTLWETVEIGESFRRAKPDGSLAPQRVVCRRAASALGNEGYPFVTETFPISGIVHKEEHFN
ncbi:hypothetical protein PO909_015234 [Leuciscus waleckii]